MHYRKYIIGIALALLALWGLAPISTKAASSDPEFDLALQWMYETGMTKYTTMSSYGPELWLTREQAAKFFAIYMEDVLDNHDMHVDGCTFIDSDMFDPTLAFHVTRSCALGLFRGSAGAFLPQQPLTKAQALTVLVRAGSGNQDESMTPRWNQYFIQAKELGLTKETDVRGLDRPVTRYEIALMLYRSVHGYDPDLQDMSSIEQLLLELGLKSM